MSTGADNHAPDHVSTRGLRDRVYEQLKQLLIEGQVEPGSRLVIDHLAEQLGVSHTPLREALSRLEADRLVSKTANKGYTTAPLLDASHLLQLWEARLILEPPSTELAVMRKGHELARKLAPAFQRLERAPAGRSYDEYRQVGDADSAFHAILAEMSGNEYIFEMITRLRPHQQAARLWARTGVPSLPAVVTEHRVVLDAVEAGDASAAGEAMRTHLQNSRGRMLATLDPTIHPPREPD